MYSLFSSVSNLNNNVIKAAGYDVIRRSYHRDLLNVVSYFHDHIFSVKGNHLLCRVINNSSAPFQYELDRYVDVILTRSPYVSKLYNFTSELTYGKLQDGVFYGSGNQELIIYNEEYFNPFEAIKDWKNIQAVKVLEHPFSDLNMTLPDGNDTRSEKGFCVISINIPLLLVQYRGFIEEQQIRFQADEGGAGVAQFVHRYVLPGMLQSHMEIAIMNRLMNLYYGAPMTVNSKRLPIPIVHYEISVDRCLREILEHIQGSGMYYVSMLKNIPGILSRDAQELLIMPDLTPTRQVWWALFITRLRQIQFLVDVGGDRGKAMNGTLINQMKIAIRRLLEENSMTMTLRDDLYYDKLEVLKSLYAF